MTITLTAAEARVLQYLDDVDGDIEDTADVAAALTTQFSAVYRLAASWAPMRFAKEGSVSTSSTGAADLSSLAPQRIVAVNYSSGQARAPIPEASFSDGPTDAYGVRTLKILYVPSLTFPAAGGDSFVWGQSGIDLPELDDLMCLRAASTLSVLLDDTNKQLEALIVRAEKNLERILNPGTGWKIMPLRGRSRDSGLAYVMTSATTLQLVSLRLSSALVGLG